MVSTKEKESKKEKASVSAEASFKQATVAKSSKTKHSVNAEEGMMENAACLPPLVEFKTYFETYTPGKRQRHAEEMREDTKAYLRKMKEYNKLTTSPQPKRSAAQLPASPAPLPAQLPGTPSTPKVRPDPPILKGMTTTKKKQKLETYVEELEDYVDSRQSKIRKLEKDHKTTIETLTRDLKAAAKKDKDKIQKQCDQLTADVEKLNNELEMLHKLKDSAELAWDFSEEAVRLLVADYDCVEWAKLTLDEDGNEKKKPLKLHEIPERLYVETDDDYKHEKALRPKQGVTPFIRLDAITLLVKAIGEITRPRNKELHKKSVKYLAEEGLSCAQEVCHKEVSLRARAGIGREGPTNVPKCGQSPSMDGRVYEGESLRNR